MNQSQSLSNVILAVDGSEHAHAATLLLDNMVGESDCTITIIAVLDTPHTPRRQLLLDAIQQSQAILQKTGRDVICGLLHGNPAAAICDYSNDHSPDLIILGAKGRRATLGIMVRRCCTAGDRICTLSSINCPRPLSRTTKNTRSCRWI